MKILYTLLLAFFSTVPYCQLAANYQVQIVELLNRVCDDGFTPNEKHFQRAYCNINATFIKGGYYKKDTYEPFVHNAEPISLIRLQSDQLNLFIPNMFSPNGDGQNDTFHVYGDGIATTNFKFIIHNRWGEVVYQVIGDGALYEIQTNGWDGKFKGEDQPVGTYIWTMSGFDINQQPLLFNGKNSGTILLRR